MTINRNISRFCRREDGATSVEYCVMVALILLVLIVGLLSTGGGVAGWWGDIDTDLGTHGF